MVLFLNGIVFLFGVLSETKRIYGKVEVTPQEDGTLFIHADLGRVLQTKKIKPIQAIPFHGYVLVKEASWNKYVFMTREACQKLGLKIEEKKVSCFHCKVLVGQESLLLIRDGKRIDLVICVPLTFGYFIFFYYAFMKCFGKYTSRFLHGKK